MMDLSDMETLLALLTVRAALIELKWRVESNLEKWGRGRPPKSKLSNNDEQPLVPTDMVTAALAITHLEDEPLSTINL